MAIGSSYSYNLPFLEASNPYQKGQTQGYHQAINYGGAPTTTAQVAPSYRELSTQDYERAQAFIDGNYNVQGSNLCATQGTNKVPNSKGAAFEGFSVPSNNGTGELSPKYEPGEKLIDLMA